jgi:lipopolysaccharide heptosyltransferase II
MNRTILPGMVLEHTSLPDTVLNASAWSRARRLLCVRLDYLGDVLMCTPALRALKSSGMSDMSGTSGSHPPQGRHISLLTSPGGAAAARFVPEVDDILEYEAPWLKHGSTHAVADDLGMIESLRAARYDAAVIFTTYTQSALPAAMLCYVAGIPLRLAHCRENPYQLLSDWIPEPEPQDMVRHEVRRQLDLVAAIGCRTPNEKLSFSVPESDTKWASQHLASLGFAATGGAETHRPWLLLHPGASAASRRYPIRHWVEVIRQLTELGHPILLTGGVGEAELLAQIAPCSRPSIHIEAGSLGLGQLAALISSASVVICNNSGPAHIAAALGTPVVDLYALTNPQHTPWQVESRVLFHEVPCRNCYKSVCPQGHHDCLEKVAPHQVIEAVRQLLEHGRRRAGLAATQLPPECTSAIREMDLAGAVLPSLRSSAAFAVK